MQGMNPYSLMFGKKPKEYIVRPLQSHEIIENFTEEDSQQQIYIIMGIRGCGKTVLMTDIANQIEKSGDWKTVELNSALDMDKTLMEKLYKDNEMYKFFSRAKLDLSFFGIGVHIEGEPPISDPETAIEEMLKIMKKHNKRLLITVDEAVNSNSMKAFAGTFQIMVRKDLPIYLLMTGLYENISEIQDEKNLTFLYRAPKIELAPLNLGAIADNYSKVFKIDREKALEYASLTNGYSFAFQLLGHFMWEDDLDMDIVLPQYKQYLEEFSYNKIWSELSQKDKKVCFAIAESKTGKINEILSLSGLKNNEISPYRKRLIMRGIVNGNEYGMLRFTLPLFSEFVTEQKIIENN